MQLPHEIFAYYYAKANARWKDLFLGSHQDAERRREFWGELLRRNDPRLEGHPARDRPDFAYHAIPLSIHGDGVPVFSVGKHGSKSFDTYSMMSMWAKGASLCVKMYLFGIFKDCIEANAENGSGAMQHIWKVQCWSFHFLYLGVWPTVDWNGKELTDPSAKALAGKPLADGFFCIVYSIKGDLEHFCNTLGLKQHGAHDFCDVCPCVRHGPPDKNPFNFGPTSSWVRAPYNPTQWRALYDGRFLHWIFSLAHVSNLTLDPDELHVIHLGVQQWFLGSVTWILVYAVMRGTPTENVDALWAFIRGYYLRNRVETQYTNFGLNFFTNPARPRLQYPCLKGRGAECKGLVGALLEAWQHFNPRGDARVRICLLRQLEVNETISANADNMFIPREDVPGFQRAIYEFLENYTSLAISATDNGDLLFNTTAKLHWYYHLGERAAFLNPRVGSCWLDEDFVGRFKTIVHACGFGLASHRVPQQAMEKYRWCLHFLAKQ